MTSMTTTDVVCVLKRKAISLAAWGCLLLTPVIAAQAANDAPTETATTTEAKSFASAVKRDAKAVGASCMEGARRVGLASKAVAHEIATAAKRGAAETRAALRGAKTLTPKG